MNIGLYDADLATYHSLPLNLEIMKLSAYHKIRERDIVSITPYFNPEPYSKYYVRKDFYDGFFHKDLMKHDNIIYGGCAFSSGRHIPLAEEIELMKPDQHIYDKLLKLPEYSKQSFWGKSADEFSHFRLSLDGETIWDKYEKALEQNDKIYVYYNHDINLGELSEGYDTIQEILKNSKGQFGLTSARFGCKYPIQTENFEQAIKWLDMSLSKSTTVQFNGIMTDEQFLQLLRHENLHHFAYQVVFPQSFTNEKKKEHLLKIFLWATIVWKRFRKFSLYISQDFLESDKWQKFFDLINFIMFSQILRKRSRIYVTFYDVCCHLPDNKSFNDKGIVTKSDAREVFGFIQDNHEELFSKLYTTYDVIEEGGRIIDVSKNKYGNS